MFFCRTCRAKAFSRLSFVRFCVSGLDFDPVAMPFSSPNPWSPAAGDHGLGEEKGIATGSKSSPDTQNRTNDRREKALARHVLQKNIHFSAACEAVPSRYPC